MDNIATRPIEGRDFDVVATLFDAYRQFYGMAPDRQRAMAFIRARVERFESTIFVAEEVSGNVVGFCQLYPTFCSVFAAPIYVLYDLFVASDARRRGAGSALLAAAEHFAATHGAIRLDLRTARTNLQAQALYESSGWMRDEQFYHYSIVPSPRQ